MAETSEFLKYERVAGKVYPQGRLLRAWKLAGGISALVTALEIAWPDGAAHKVVVRQHQGSNLINNANVARLEYKVLGILKAGGVAVPTPLFLDFSGEIFPTPYLVIEFIEGQSNFTPTNLEGYLKQAATALAEIHRVNSATEDLSFLRNMGKRVGEILANPPAQMDDSLDEPCIRAALEKIWPLPQTNQNCLLHGDYWPGNILWQGDQLAAVIDWEDASLGDPLADLANSRMEFLWAFGVEAMETFTRYYQGKMPLDYTNLGYWELAAALRPAGQLGEWAGNPEKEKIMRERHKIFVTQAFERINQL